MLCMLENFRKRKAHTNRVFALYAVVLLAAPAFAQDRPASSPQPAATSKSSDDIVVVGSPDRDQQVRDFVRGMTPTMEESLARWDVTDACPITIGLTPADDQAITDRLRRVATAAKIPLAAPDCTKPNLLVIFTTDRRAMVQELSKRAPGWFHDIHGDPIPMPKDDGPVSAWHVNGEADRYGKQLHMPPGGGPIANRTTGLASRIETMVRPVYLFSIVVIERSGAVGLTRTQLADYAAMRAFTDAKPAQTAQLGTPSILTVMDAPMGSETPPSMTSWDLAFLKGLYQAPETMHASAQRGAIIESMKRGLGGDQAK